MARRGGQDRGKEWKWRRLLRHWRRSGQSVRAYCWEHRVSEPSFYAWRRTIAERDRQARGPGRRRRRPDDSRTPCDAADRSPAFLPVQVTMPPPALEIVLRDGRLVRVPSGFDAATLRQLLAVMEETPSC